MVVAIVVKWFEHMLVVAAWYGMETVCRSGRKVYNDNDNDKRLGLTAKADQPDHRKYSTLKIKLTMKQCKSLISK